MSDISERIGRLAGLLGVDSRYVDGMGREMLAPEDSVRAIIAAMGYDVATEAGIAATIEAVEDDQRRRLICDTWCINEGGWLCFPVRQPAGDYRWTIELDGGGMISGEGRLETLYNYEGEAIPSRALPILEPVPVGIHRLVVETDQRAAEGTVIVAPPNAYGVADAAGEGARLWGAMVPLYGLVSNRNFAIGDFEDLKRLSEKLAGLGADFVGINPVHALFPELPETASPYSPSSRLFLNVMHIAPDRVPEFAECAPARRFAAERALVLAAERSKPLVDYTRAASMKLPLFELIFSTFLEKAADAPRRRAFEAYRQARGARLRKHALFDALSRYFAMTGRYHSWLQWPSAYQDPDSAAVAEFERDFERDVLFFEYLQWNAEIQLEEAGAKAREAGMKLGLYLDLAVGVAADGADVWAAPGDYANGVSIGAPPDAFAPGGQRWGLAPFNPVALRKSHFAPFVELLRAVMRHAGVIRIDHVLGLARSFWMPDGLPGAYVRYPLHDLLAIVAVESRRHGTVVIGEDLGTIPGGMREALASRGVLGCRLAYFEWDSDGAFLSPTRYPANIVASIGSHDLPPLKGYWLGRDIEHRARIGDPEPEVLAAQRQDRAEDRRALCHLVGHEIDPETDPRDDPRALDAVMAGLNRELARSPAQLVAIESENMLGLDEQPNLPGTVDEHPNWRRRLPVSVEAFDHDDGVRATSAIMREERVPIALPQPAES